MYRNNSHLVQKYAEISPVSRGKQFSSKTVTLKEQVVHCLKSNAGYRDYFPSNVFLKLAGSFENCVMSLGCSPV